MSELKPCPDCGRELSPSARSCPGCGKHAPHTSRAETAAATGLVLVGCWPVLLAAALPAILLIWWLLS